MMELIFTKGPKAGERFAVKSDRVSIGRLAECDLELDQPNVSRKHALIKRTGDRVFLVDNRSGNGTYVNGKRITRVDLHAGDEVRIGSNTIRVEMRTTKDRPDEQPTRQDPVSRFLIKDQTGGVSHLEFAGESLTIGRGEKCKLVLDDAEVSRLQARIRYGQGRFELKDAGSANGTYLNGERVSEAELKSGDRIEMGGIAIAIQIVAGALHLTVTRRVAAQAAVEPMAPKPAPPQNAPRPQPPPSRSQAAVPRPRKLRLRYPIISGLVLALAVALLLVFVGRTHASPRVPPRPAASPRIDAARGPVYSSHEFSAPRLAEILQGRK